ncbi:MAG: T6SS effector amidase Tae4 family protein [Flavobacterium sp.]
MDFNENTVDETSKNGISFKTFKSRTGLHEFKKTINLPNESINFKGKTNFQNHNIFKEFIIDTSYIKQCVVQNQTTYSFKIIPKIKTSNSVFNLIVHNKNGVWETTIIEMMPSKQNLKDLISGNSKQFKGKMRLIYQSNPFQKSNNNLSARASTTGTGYTTIFVESSHCTGTKECASGTCDKCNLCVSYSSYRVPVTGEAVEAIEESPNGDTQGSGGGNGSSYSDPSGYVIDPNLFDVTHPKAYLILQKAEKAAAFWTDLLNVQKEWAVDNPEKYITVIEFYLENTSPESKAFAEFAINFLKDNSGVTWEQFENWFMGTSEGQDGEYDAAFWEDPNLTFPPQNLPTLAAFKSAMPLKYTDGGTLCNSLGGDVLKMYNDVIAKGRKLNTCAIRVSIALIKCGIVIPFIPDSKKGFKNTIKDKDGNYLIINAKVLNEWMRKTFGTNPANYRHFTAAQGGVKGRNFPKLMEDVGSDGIYSMVSRPEIHETWGTGHADILEEGDCRIKCHFFDEKNNFVPVDYIDVWILK